MNGRGTSTSRVVYTLLARKSQEKPRSTQFLPRHIKRATPSVQESKRHVFPDQVDLVGKRPGKRYTARSRMKFEALLSRASGGFIITLKP